jgi:hypothetical protein
MQVDGIGSMELTIQLSCQAHPLQLVARIAQAVEAVKTAVVAVVTVLVALARRIFSAPGKARI